MLNNNKIKLTTIIFFIILFWFTSPVEAQQCINGGVTCCTINTVTNQCTDYTVPGSCNSLCQGICPAGTRKEDENCYVQGATPPPGGGGGGGPTCPAGTTRMCGTPQVLTCPQTAGCNFPQRTTSTWCAQTGSERNGNLRDWNFCQTNCACCAAGQTYVNGTGCVSPCNTTAATGITFTNNALNWTAGLNGTSQRLYVSATESDVANNCGAGSSCIVNQSLLASTTTYTFLSILPPSTQYWVKIITIRDATCSTATVPISFITPAINDPWWQVEDGDVTTNESISSDVPNGALFNTVGLGGFPGVPVYGGTFNLLPSYPTRVSTTVWNANTTTKQTRLFNYEFFEKLITDDIAFSDITQLPDGVGATLDANGYEWYRVTGNLNTSGDIDLGARKVILFIDSGNLTIGGKINLDDNQGFFGAFVNGSITVDPTVTGTPSIEGIYLSDGTFSSSVGTTQLHVRGSVASFGDVSLGRDLTDNTNPAELFEFAPDQLVLFPEKLMNKRAKWTEVAP